MTDAITMSQTRNAGAVLGQRIASVEAELGAIKRKAQAMANELAAARQAQADAQNAQQAAEVERDEALARLADAEHALRGERAIRHRATAALTEACAILALDEFPEERVEATGESGIASQETSTETAMHLLPVQMPPAVADACARIVADGAAPATMTALFQLAELGIRELHAPVSREIRRTDDSGCSGGRIPRSR